jgi:hypothetical protein
MDRRVDEAVELVLTMCTADLMSKEEAVDFLDRVIERLEEVGVARSDEAVQ